MRNISILVIISIVTFAHPGIGIVEDSKGNVFFTDLKQVWKIDLFGKKSVVVPGVHTHELYLDANDNLFGEHLWYNGEEKNTWGFYVWKLTPGGIVDKVVPDTDGFREAYSFVRDRSGNMFKPERGESCQKLMKGKSRDYVSHGDRCYHNIRFMAISENDEVLLVDFQDVIKIDKLGNSKIVASKIADKSAIKSNVSNQNSVMGIWADNEGNIYTAVYSNRVVKKFTPDGKDEIVFKSTFPWAPSGGMVSRKGELWILEGSLLNDARVVKISSTGIVKAF